MHAVLAHGCSLTLLVAWHSSRHTPHSVLFSHHAILATLQFLLEIGQPENSMAASYLQLPTLSWDIYVPALSSQFQNSGCSFLHSTHPLIPRPRTQQLVDSLPAGSKTIQPPAPHLKRGTPYKLSPRSYKLALRFPTETVCLFPQSLWSITSIGLSGSSAYSHRKIGEEKKAEQSRAHIALAEDPSLGFSTHIGELTTAC